MWYLSKSSSAKYFIFDSKIKIRFRFQSGYIIVNQQIAPSPASPWHSTSFSTISPASNLSLKFETRFDTNLFQSKLWKL